MAAKADPPSARRAEVRVYPAESILAWLDRHTGPGRRFYNRTHAFEAGIAALMREAGDRPP
ncbi:MAG TPA: hypothetical protein VFH47_07895 [Candidatus Thermoplasmatota archaeon]|nr:hypothetical protein [Candidatus Thermoplasmatota archaeon]